MDTRKIPVLCYWNGCIKDGLDGPYYEGSLPRVIRVESNVDLPKLLDHLHRVTGFEKGKFQIDLICRYPYIVQKSMVKYVRMPIVDGCSLETMLEVPSYHSSINNVELYLEVKPVLDERIGPIGAVASSLANQATRKRSRQEDGNTDADVNVSVRDNTLRTPQEGNSNGWIEEEESMEGGGNGGNSGTAQKDANMKSPVPTISLIDKVSEQMIFSSSWLDERELRLGMVFRDKYELEKAVKLYSNRRQRNYTKYENNFSGIYEYKCFAYCGWNLKAAKTDSNGFKVTEYRGPHSCKPANVSSDFLAGELKGLIKAHPSLSVAELNMWVKEEFGYTVSWTNMWDAKKKAIAAILRDSDNCFNVFTKFMAALSSSNKMVLEWQYDLFPDPKDAYFRSVFWAFQQSIEGFTHLRPLIIVDTIELNGKLPAKMLVAGGFDAENRFFPLAFAITTQESLSADTWRWFFTCIRKKVTQREGLCLITSMDPDIVAVVTEPECQWAQHRFCLRHMCLKFYDVFKNNLMTELVYKAGSTMNISSFDYFLKKIKKLNPEARKWLEKIPLHQWALAYDDGGLRFGIMTANTIFTTYGFINRITTCILLIFDHLVELFKSRHGLPAESLNGRDLYAKHVMKNLEEYKVASQTHDVLPLDQIGDMFQVTEMMQVEKKGFIVHISKRVCTCGTWQLCKYPCSHVLAACRRMNSDYLQYVNDCYKTESSVRVYAADFYPLPGVSDWPEASEVPRLFPPGTRPQSVVRPDTATSKLVIGRKRSTQKKA